MTDRSLLTVVTDTFTAPRWIHHAVKFATGSVVLAVCVTLLVVCGATDKTRILIASALLSFAWFLTLRVSYWLDHRSDLGPRALVTPDLFCDLALHAAPIGIAYAAAGMWTIGLSLLFVCAVTYVVTYPEASP